MRVGLVGCVKSKREHPAPACELYTSPLFRGRRRSVEGSCERWFILSALHGLLNPDEIVEPYNLAMSEVPRPERREWSSKVLADLRRELGPVDGMTIEIHAGADYANFGLVDGLRAAGAEVEQPTAGMTIGVQLAWYADRQDAGRPAADTVTRTAGPAAATSAGSKRRSAGRYAPLSTILGEAEDATVTLTFQDIESVLGRDLPASARTHRAWWANGGHTQADAWLGAGYRVDAVDLRQGWVRFHRATS